jgi:hypothetical protein
VRAGDVARHVGRWTIRGRALGAEPPAGRVERLDRRVAGGCACWHD